MQINTQFNAGYLNAIAAQNRPLPQAIGSTGATGAAAGASSVVNISSAASELEAFMKMSEAERMQWIWLHSHGVTPEEFAAMSDDEKQQLLDQMKEELKITMQAQPQQAQQSKDATRAQNELL